MKVERFNLRKKEDFDKYYPTLKKWWEDWGFTPQTPNLLSQNGLMVSKDGYKCAGWVFVTDSDVCVLGWWISDKDADKEGCMEFLITELEKLAITLGCKVSMTPANNESLKKKLEKLGHGNFADKNYTNYLKRL